MSPHRSSAAAADEVASVSSLSVQRAKRGRTAAGDQARRAVAYVRESTEEQGRGYSPDGQRQAISRYASEHDLELIDEYLDFETGRAADKRPGFQRLIEDAMEHRFECVLIFHTSRFARNTVEAKRYKKLLRSELGIDVISVTPATRHRRRRPCRVPVRVGPRDLRRVLLPLTLLLDQDGAAREGPPGTPYRQPAMGLPQGRGRHRRTRPVKAPFVRGLFERYASGLHTDRSLAEWLNANDQRTTRVRSFGSDTVREMLCNAAYCGYVSARRDRNKEIRGLHEPIVEEALFDRVSQMRRQRARTLKPGRPSNRYLLRGLARCERCQGKMHGTAVGRKLAARYYCATRRSEHTCDQPLVPAEAIEQQLVAFVADFKPAADLRQEILDRLAATSTTETAEVAKRRVALEERLRRMRDLYDLDRPDYLARREAIHAELAQLAPPAARPRPSPQRARRLRHLLAAGDRP